jgi:hypothetical protein
VSANSIFYAIENDLHVFNPYFKHEAYHKLKAQRVARIAYIGILGLKVFRFDALPISRNAAAKQLAVLRSNIDKGLPYRTENFIKNL